MNSDSYHRPLIPLMQGTKVKSISKHVLESSDMVMPSSEKEQSIIGDYFSELDSMIEIHQKEIDRLMLPMHNGFIKKETFENELELRYGKKVNVSPFNGTYTGLFEHLNLVSISDEGYKQNNRYFRSFGHNQYLLSRQIYQNEATYRLFCDCLEENLQSYWGKEYWMVILR